MALSLRDEDDSESILDISISQEEECKKKILEEDEYLDRVANIIKRDFFPQSEYLTTPSHGTPVMGVRRDDTPKSVMTSYTSTSSMKSRDYACSLGLNEFFDKYTSEDNAYFDKIQRKELKRHRLRFPWLYRNRQDSNGKDLQVTSKGDNALQLESKIQMIDWHYPLNSNISHHRTNSAGSTVNYRAKNYFQEPIFKQPLPVPSEEKTKSQLRPTNKIGVDGKLLDGSDSIFINGYSYIPPPETPLSTMETSIVKSEPRYNIPIQSPRDGLAHRLYEEKVAKRIRTPKSSSRSDLTSGTPGSAQSTKWRF